MPFIVSRYFTTTFNKNVVVAKTSYQILEVLQLILRSGGGLTSSNEDFWWKKSTIKHFILFLFLLSLYNGNTYFQTVLRCVCPMSNQ